MPSFLIPRSLRTLRRVLTPLLLVCVAAATAEAAPHVKAGSRGVSRHHHLTHARRGTRTTVPAPAPSCGTALTLRALQRQSRPVGGPVARGSVPGSIGLRLPNPLFKHRTHSRVSDDEAAIANDAPIAPTAGDESVRPALRPLGLLVCSLDQLVPSGEVARRSSRGPPQSV